MSKDPNGSFNELAKTTIRGPRTLSLEGGFVGSKLVASGASEDPFAALALDLDGLITYGTNLFTYMIAPNAGARALYWHPIYPLTRL